YIAYRAQSKPGFESDRWRLMLYDRKTGQSHSMTDAFDSSVEAFAFSPDGQKIYFTALDHGRQPIYELPVGGRAIKKLINEAFNDDVQVSADGKMLLFTRQSLTQPIEIFKADSASANATRLTKTNDELLADFGLKPAEEVSWDGASGAKVYGWGVKPPHFTANKKWPLICLIHCRPQAASARSW